MSNRVPGVSDEEMRSYWNGFVMKKFGRTGMKTTFNGKTRNVYTDKRFLYVLDEKHGDLEVLKYQEGKGPAVHVGSQEIDAVFELKPGEKVGRLKEMKLGRMKTGGSMHKFILT